MSVQKENVVPAEKRRFSPSDFDVVSKSTEGVDMPLFFPDGTKTNESLKVRGADSPKFLAAKARYNRALLALNKDRKLRPEDREARSRKLLTRLIAEGLIVGWSFEEPFSTEAVIQFFEIAPYAQEQADSFGGTVTNFFSRPSED